MTGRGSPWRRQTFALLKADVRPFTHRSGLAVTGVGLFAIVALTFIFAVAGPTASRRASALVLPPGTAVAALAALYSLTSLGYFQGARLVTRASDLIATLPLDRRLPWTLSHARVALFVSLTGAGGSAIGAVILAVAPRSPVGATYLWASAAVAGVALAFLFGHTIAVFTAGAHAPVRWAAWGVLAIPVLAFSAVLVATVDPLAALPFAGTAGALALAVQAAAEAGPFHTTLLWLGAALGALAFARLRLPARAFDREASLGEGINQPFPTEDEGAPSPAEPAPLPSPPGADVEAQRTAMATSMEQLRARGEMSGGTEEFEPLPIPAGIDATLRYLATRPQTWGSPGVWVALGLLAIVLVLVVTVTPSVRIPRGVVPGSFGSFVAWSLLLIAFLAAGSTAPGVKRRAARRAKEEKHKAADLETPAKPPKPAAKRARPAKAFIRRWALLQTFPVDQTQMARALLPPRNEAILACAVSGAVVGIAAIVLQADAQGLLFVGWILLVCLAFLAAAAFPPTGGAYVPHGYSRWRTAARYGASTAWFIGGFGSLAFVITISFLALGGPVDDWVLYASAIPATAGATSPYFLYREARQRLVSAQRPYESDLRLAAVLAGGLVLAATGIAATLPLL